MMTMAKRKSSTIAALLEEKPKRGRPRRPVSRKNVYVALSKAQKQQMRTLAESFPHGIARADIPDMAISLLAVRMESLHHAVADRDRDIPEGITDLDSLYLLWDLALPDKNSKPQWTSIRLSPQRIIEFGRVHGVLNALFGANRSDVFSLGLSLLVQFLGAELPDRKLNSLEEVRKRIDHIYL
jgi:hypothetical protein